MPRSHLAMSLCLALLVGPVFGMAVAPSSVEARAAGSAATNPIAVVGPGETRTAQAETAGPRLAGECFLENQGQAAPDVVYYQANGHLAFTDRGLRLVLRDGDRGHTVLLSFEGARPTTPRGTSGVCAWNHMYLGRPASNTATVPSYHAVLYGGLYPGIDLIVLAADRGLKYEFLVAPGGDPAAIRVRVEGATLGITSDGAIRLGTPLGEVVDAAPVAYQGDGPSRQNVRASFQILGNAYGFSLGPFNPALPLVIDPEVYSTLLGGDNQDAVTAIAIDGAGNSYVVGYTMSIDFPTTPGAFETTLNGRNDVFVAKVSADGDALLYATFLGGEGDDWGYDIALDSSGNVYVTGATESFGFPVTNGAYDTSKNGGDDAFVLKLDPTGSLAWATFFGGSAYDSAFALGIRAIGVVVAGHTDSLDLPTTTGAYDRSLNGGRDVFVAAFSTAGNSLAFSTFFGGANTDELLAMALDGTGNAWIAGATSSFDMPTTAGAIDRSFNGYYDAFLARISSDGRSLLYSTFIGGTYFDGAFAVGIGITGEVYVGGGTNSGNFPTTAGAYDRTANGAGEDGFLLKTSADGGSLIYSTYVGGTDSDGIAGKLFIDSTGRVYASGSTYSADFPVTPDAVQRTLGGGSDGLVAELDATGSTLLYATFLGGGMEDQVLGLAFEPGPFLRIVGQTTSADFPTTLAAYDTSCGSDGFCGETVLGASGRAEGFIAEIGLAPNTAPHPALTASPLIGNTGTSFTLDASGSTDAEDPATNLQVRWDWNGDGAWDTAWSTTKVTTHTFGAGGVYEVRVWVKDSGRLSDVARVVIEVDPVIHLRVTTAIDTHPGSGVPAKVYVDGIVRDEWATAWLTLSPGSHTVSFSDVPGVSTPAPIAVNAPSGDVVVQGVYRALGWLRITTDPPVPAPILVNGNGVDLWGAWMGIPPGTYVVSFGPLAKYAPPGAQSVSVVAEQTTAVVGHYTYDGTSLGTDWSVNGVLRAMTFVDGSLGAPARIYVDGVQRDDWGTYVIVPVGQHVVSFSDVPGLATPHSAEVLVQPAEYPTGLAGGFYAVEGWLRVTTNPALPTTVLVDGIPRNNWGMWQSITPGRHVVSFAPVAGYATPGAQVVVVAKGSLTSVMGNYVPASPTVSSAEGGGSATVLGLSSARLAAVLPRRPEW